MKPRQIDLSIDSITKEGFGKGSVAFPEGKISPVEVPFTAQGDRVSVLLLPKRSGVYQSRLLQIIAPAAERIEPRCLHFASCGGCRWQHIAYEEQLRMKETWVRKLLSPYLDGSESFYPILGCTPPWHYRNKMEFSFSTDKAQNRYLGLILQGSGGKVFNISECHLVHPWFMDGVKAVRDWWELSGLEAYRTGKDSGSLRSVTMREGLRSGDRMVMLTVSGNPAFALHKKQIDEFVIALRRSIEPTDQQQHLSIFIRIQQILKGSPTNFYEMHLYGPDHIREQLKVASGDNSISELSFRISPTAFFQPNTAGAEQLYSKALQLVQIEPTDLVYDLYCGTGTLGICAAKRAERVVGIEIVPESVLDARENIKINGLSNIEILKGDVGKVLAELALEPNRKKPNLVMVDPPRAGLDNRALQHLINLNAKKILYISCNPTTQAANLKELVERGYRVKAVQPVDQFPHTIHIENIVVLELSNL